MAMLTMALRAEAPGPATHQPPPWSPWRPCVDRRRQAARSRPSLVTAIKAVHTLAWFSIEMSFVYLLYAGFKKRTDQKAAVAAAIVGGETFIYAANGFRCPLTELALRYGADDGSVTDIFLPDWFAHNIPAIHTPLLPLAAYLHVRNLRQSAAARHRTSVGPVASGQ